MQFFCRERDEKACFRTFSVSTGTTTSGGNETQILISDEFSKIYVRINLKIEQRINFELRFSATSRRFCQFSLLPRERTPFN